MEYKVCIKCEYKLPHSAKYCRMCGISLRDTDQNNVQTILSKETEILATSSVEANEQKIEMERNLIIKELNDEKTAQMQLQNYLLEQQFIQKERSIRFMMA